MTVAGIIASTRISKVSSLPAPSMGGKEIPGQEQGFFLGQHQAQVVDSTPRCRTKAPLPPRVTSSSFSVSKAGASGAVEPVVIPQPQSDRQSGGDSNPYSHAVSQAGPHQVPLAGRPAAQPSMPPPAGARRRSSTSATVSPYTAQGWQAPTKPSSAGTPSRVPHYAASSASTSSRISSHHTASNDSQSGPTGNAGKEKWTRFIADGPTDHPELNRLENFAHSAEMLKAFKRVSLHLGCGSLTSLKNAALYCFASVPLISNLLCHGCSNLVCESSARTSLKHVTRPC